MCMQLDLTMGYIVRKLGGLEILVNLKRGVG